MQPHSSVDHKNPRPKPTAWLTVDAVKAALRSNILGASAFADSVRDEMANAVMALLPTQPTAKAVIAAIDQADRDYNRYAGDRIVALPNRNLGEEAADRWRREWPGKSLDDFRIPAVMALLPGRPESVVKAEALREAKAEFDAAGSFLPAKWAAAKLAEIAIRIEAGKHE